MESNMEDFLLSNATALDLGLSLKTLHPQACHPVDQGSQAMHMDYEIGSTVGCNEPTEWPYVHALHPKSPKCSKTTTNNDCSEEMEGVQSKARWAYIKVNLDGLVVGRKTCLVYHATYSSLALQLEHMFGGLTKHGLRLFEYGSEFILFYKDREDNWRSAGDVPWLVFVDCAKRLRIVRKNNVLASYETLPQ